MLKSQRTEEVLGNMQPEAAMADRQQLENDEPWEYWSGSGRRMDLNEFGPPPSYAETQETNSVIVWMRRLGPRINIWDPGPLRGLKEKRVSFGGVKAEKLAMM